MWSHMSFVAVFALFPKLSPLLFYCFCYSLRLWGDFPHLCFLFVPIDLLPPAFSSHFFIIRSSQPPTSVFLCVIISCACSPSLPLFFTLILFLLAFSASQQASFTSFLICFFPPSLLSRYF